MPFTNKEIRLDEFMTRLHQRIQRGDNADALAFFECFLQEQLPEKLKQAATAEWDGQAVNAGDFDALYPMAVEILHDAATRMESEVHPTIYEEASAVSSAFCDELNETFQCSGDDAFDPIPIKSFVQVAAEAGIVNMTPGPDGQTMVTLTEEGEKLARETEEQIRLAQK